MKSNLRILLIDDEKAFIDTIALRLREECHHQTTIVYSALEAVQKLETMTAGVDVILVDYDMPGMNGLEFLTWMKANGKETPVIVLTGMSSEEIASDAMKLGAYDYLRKEEFDLKSLAHAVDATYERRLYHIAQESEAEREQELGMNLQATNKVRDVLNTISPPLHSAIANINFELEVKSGKILKELPPSSRDKVKSLLADVLKEVRVLEMSVRGLLTLYRILYAHHKEEGEIEEIRRDMEKRLKSKPLR